MKLTPLVALYLLVSSAYSQKPNRYSYLIDLEHAGGDRIEVSLSPPLINDAETEFIFPISVPGYYNVNLKYSELISGFKALNAQGEPLAVRKKGNAWVIQNAPTLRTIKYQVDDVWEVKDSLSHWIAAENIFEKDKVFLLNQGATMGYFKNMEALPFHVQIKFPGTLYAATGAELEGDQKGSITYDAKNYQELTDKPILFTPTEPLRFKVANTEVVISTYADNGNTTNQSIYKILYPVLNNISRYLGNKLPVNKYAFLGYFYRGPIFASAMLEHNNSAVFVCPEQWDEKLLGSSFTDNITEAAYHEFFHILTPLNVHSEEVLHFNFSSPSMSKHLWLYEGMTEYLSYHVQVNQYAISTDNFYRSLEHFVTEMKEYKSDVSLTEISQRTYGDLNDEYDNVELKGVLVNLLLDIRLRELSGGRNGIKQLIQALVKRFGKDKAFKEDELFDTIASMTNPAVRNFFTLYVEGTEPIPLKEYLGKVGLRYDDQENKITVNPDASSDQTALRDSWLYK